MKKETLNNLFEALLSKYFDLQMVSLCTSDGFGVLHKARLQGEVELERISAITSSLVSLGSASSKQIIGGNLHSTIVETDSGNLLMKKLKLAEKELVLSIVTSKKMLLGEANYVISQCAKTLSKL